MKGVAFNDGSPEDVNTYRLLRHVFTSLNTKRCPVIALLAGMSLAAGLLLTGCELSGLYKDDDVTVQFGNTNLAAQVEAD